MKLLTKAIEKKLRANGAVQDGDHKPAVKFFGGAAATWLISELAEDGDTMFGLCDLGMGSPELGYVSLQELKDASIGMFNRIERDMYWTANKTLAEYAAEAREAGYIKA